MMRFFLFLVSFIILWMTTLLLPPPLYAQTEVTIPQEVFYKARVVEVIEQRQEKIADTVNPYQKVKVRILDGGLKNSDLIIEQGGKDLILIKSQLVKKGDVVVVVQSFDPDNLPVYHIVDTYRLDTVLWFIGVFLIAVIWLSRWQGIGSLIGMVISLVVIIKFIVPEILANKDPLIVSIIGCLVIMTTTIYLAHGFSRKTTIALISTFITLVITGIFAVICTSFAHLTGLGNEDAYNLTLGITAQINFKGLLLGGILIGALGVLDDVTTGLTASVFELAAANPKFSFEKLLQAGLSIGREHIASLVNTLVLAYAGASLPIFITIALNPNNYPLWSIFNSELIVEEVIRTLAGSIGLIMAVPLTTFLATWYVIKRERK